MKFRFVAVLSALALLSLHGGPATAQVDISQMALSCNVTGATKTIGEAGNAALRAATDWLSKTSPEADQEANLRKEAQIGAD